MKKSIGFQLPKKFSPPVIALVLAIVLFVASSFFLKGGASLAGMLKRGQTIINITAYLGLIAAGQTIVILAGGEGIDLSAGTTVTLAAIVTAVIADKTDANLPFALVAALVAGGLVGLINGIGVAILKIHPVVMTLSVSGVTMGTILAIYRGAVQGGAGPSFNTFVSMPLTVGDSSLGFTGAVAAWVFVSIVLWFILNKTQFGKHLFAIGVNRDAAHLSGVRVTRTAVLAYVLCGVFTAFGGFIVLGYIQSVYFIIGDGYLFPSIAAVVLGGTVLAGGEGSYWGTMSGALVLTVLDSILTSSQVDVSVRQIVLGVLLLAVISLYGRQKALRQ
jgi:ribose transport system permease protein